MLVSIIIPVHKTILFFKSCIESVLNQTYDNLEIIIACNGSLEVETCKEFLNINDSRIIYIKTKNGRHNARNEALSIAKGTVIQFLDYDDYLFYNKIESQLTFFDEYANCLSVCKWKKFNNTINEHYSFPNNIFFKDRNISSEQLLVLLADSGGFIATSSWLVSKALISSIKWIDSPNDDAVFFSELLIENPKIFMLNEVLAGYRIHNLNTSSIRSTDEFDKLLISWKKILFNLNKLNKKKASLYVYKAFLNLIQYSKQIDKYRLTEVVYYCFILSFRAKVGFVFLNDMKRKLLN